MDQPYRTNGLFDYGNRGVVSGSVITRMYSRIIHIWSRNNQTDKVKSAGRVLCRHVQTGSPWQISVRWVPKLNFFKNTNRRCINLTVGFYNLLLYMVSGPLCHCPHPPWACIILECVCVLVRDRKLIACSIYENRCTHELHMQQTIEPTFMSVSVHISILFSSLRSKTVTTSQYVGGYNIEWKLRRVEVTNYCT